jgi:L-lactate utilization protein LutB
MASTDNNVEHLEREVEETRAHVSETLDALQSQVAGTVQEWRGRLSYEELSKDAKNYARNSATRLAHERPMLTGAIGLAVAYPFLKLAAKIRSPST